MPNKDLDNKLAAMLAPEDSRYVLLCRECRSAWPFQRDCKTTKAARSGDALCPDCGDAIELGVDFKDE